RPVTLSLHQRTPIQALRAIMAEVPGGGFVLVEGHGAEGTRAYVLSGLGNGLTGGASIGVPPIRHGPAARTGMRRANQPPSDTQPDPKAEYIANELLLQFPPDLGERNVGDIVGAFGGEIFATADDPLTKIGYYRVRFAEGTDIMALAPILLDETPAEAAEPNYLAHAMLDSPNDPLYPLQWGLIRIEVPAAWGVTLGQGNVLVAVLDSGIDPAHPELRGALTAGWDFSADDNDPFDEQGHGTAMAGIIAAAMNNEQGIAGVAPGIRLMSVRVLDGAGRGSYAEVMSGLIYAADQGARVINMSFGGYGESRALSLALAYAHQKGALLIGAAGNEGINARVFPAADPLVIGVASTDSNNERSEASNWGMHVLLAAPGERVPTLLPNEQYALVTGTSAAAAQVTGIAALAFSINPALLNVQCAQLLIDSAENLGPPGWDERFGFGQINAAHAVRAAAHRRF
ncbi:MAG: S8 family serine peptidase, partial [Gammaproteobacteria bacterium]